MAQDSPRRTGDGQAATRLDGEQTDSPSSTAIPCAVPLPFGASTLANLTCFPLVFTAFQVP